MKDHGISFMALGGATRIGTSCYYLRLGHSNILLDCGISGAACPVFYPLLTSDFVESMGQINSVFISHAHMDHIGYLPRLIAQAPYAQIYMTEATLLMAKLQLAARGDQLAVDALLAHVTVVSYMETRDFGEYTATFYPAGHIPGAMMVLFEYRDRRVLYTGDYTIDQTALTDGCIIPQGKDIDLMIMCAIHAKQPEYSRWKDGTQCRVNSILNAAREGQIIACRNSQLSKGVELLRMLNDSNLWSIPIYYHPSIMPMVRLMEQLNCPILTKDDKPLAHIHAGEGGVIVSADDIGFLGFSHTSERVDFSLHEDFGQMKRFIGMMNPRQLLMVHTAPAQNPWDDTIEQIMLREGSVRTAFTFPVEGELYAL